MLYGQNNLSIENILKFVTEEELYEKYVLPKYNVKNLNVLLRRPLHSPFRIDNHPSFTIIKVFNVIDSKYIWFDFGLGQKGNVFKLISYMKGMYHESVLSIINKDFKLNLLDLNERDYFEGEFNWKDQILDGIKTNKLSKEVKLYEAVTPEKELKFNLNVKPHDKLTMKYWERYDNLITPEILNFEEIKPLHFIDIEGVKYIWSIKEPLYGIKCNTYFEVLNDINTNYKIKMYRPLSDKKYKWRNLINSDHIQGFKQLKTIVDNKLLDKFSKTFIFTKSMKDVMILRKLGFLSISFNSENVLPSKDVLEHFKENYLSLFDKSLILYDNDTSGQMGASKLKFVIEDKIKTNIEFLGSQNDKTKDPSDFVEKYGRDYTKKLIQNLL